MRDIRQYLHNTFQEEKKKSKRWRKLIYFDHQKYSSNLELSSFVFHLPIHILSPNKQAALSIWLMLHVKTVQQC